MVPTKLLTLTTLTSLLSLTSAYALPAAAPVDIITATASPTTAATSTSTGANGSASTLTSTAICLTETQNGIVSTRWITASFWVPMPTSLSIITGTGTKVTVVTPSATTTWRPTNTATTRDPWCTIQVPNGGTMMKRVLPREEAEEAVKKYVEKREAKAKAGYFEADLSNKNLGQADMLYCPG